MPSLFSRIARHELPAHLVYEDDHAVAFLDIQPRTEGHTLVVPRHEVAEFHALPAEEAAHLVQALRIVAAAVTRAMGTPHYNLSLNNGSAAGQVVFHVHFHIIPRREGEPFPRGRLRLAAEHMEEIAAAIRAAVAEGGELFE